MTQNLGSEMASILRSPQALQLTLALIKPDAVAHPLILEAVHQQILSNKFLIVRMRELLWRKEDCQRFYREHEGRFFYQRLVEFMASGPIRAYILAHKDAIQLWRTLMGPTRVFRARHVAPDSIRGSFGLTDTRNTTHGSGFQMKTRCGASVSSGGSCKGGAARRKEGRKHRVLHPCLKSFSGVSAALHIHCSILAQATFISYWISSLPTCLFHSHHPPPPSIHLSTHIKKVLFFRRGVVAHACNPGTLGGRGGQGRSPEVGSSRPA
ncbi:nucleoside diphosphate kinase 6 isoform X6 [Homo sapiens]|uniref:nucleoside diphosphate kinase 6 isoform X6 n=1 Tax=Homo sapiens TaxID=9606 RepID=UPI000D0C77C6|nr:nucleoside diphosphate kinase 6 isoform X6 [Homo sapiens]XP_054200863.1 nucleoside diphosphate kinase 6 isoform X6 [Homo sapiens]|eukprot:XP_024309068.1 nucleoside diphosphate kinase 6 isoform X5 [Homo sapiens]